MEQSKFISEVQSRPCIWDSRLKSYFDRYSKREAWEQIGQKMFIDFRNFSDEQKRCILREFKKKWKSLKDFYKRRNPSEDIDEKTNRKKPLVELLQFLDNVKKTDQETQTTFQYPQPETQPAKDNKSITVPQYNTPSVIVELKSTVESQEPANLEHDSNLNFLQSILPEMQNLDDRHRFEFKLGVMKLIKKIKYDAEEDEDIDNPSNTISTQRVAYYETYECFRRSSSPLMFTVHRSQSRRRSPVIYDDEPDAPITVREEYDYGSQDYYSPRRIYDPQDYYGPHRIYDPQDYYEVPYNP